MTVQEVRRKLEQKRGQQAQLEKQLSSTETKIRDTKKQLKRQEKAREIIKAVGLKTQQQLQYHISDITTLALEAVFDNPYRMEVEFVQRRNKTECDLLFERGKERFDPLTASGGGAVDVASFALRIASWSMKRPRSRNTVVLDEPMKFLSRDLHPRASAMIQEISEKLDIQFIIITHDKGLAEHADKTFEVALKGNVSEIVELNT